MNIKKCVVCDSEIVDGYCEHCRTKEEVLEFINQAHCDVMTRFDFETLVRTATMVYGHHSDHVIKIILDGRDLGTLEKFTRIVREDDSLFALFNGKPICREYYFKNSYYKLLVINTLKEGM